MFTYILLTIDLVFLAGTLYFTVESIREKEERAPKVGAVACLFFLLLAIIILGAPVLRLPIAAMLGLLIICGLACLIPGKPNEKALQGSSGYVTGDVKRVDERDVVFARNRGLPAGSEQYEAYYQAHPEKEELDARRREQGGPLGRPGSIDNEYRPNVSMLFSSFELPAFVGPHAEADPDPDRPAAELEPERATEIVKHFAKHLGADLVGICRVNPDWTYSHRGEIFYGNWDEWGRELPDPLPYAVVIGTEMVREHVDGSPHTPSVVESGVNYAQGAYITTILAHWFSLMGYKAVAEHNRHYDHLMVPLAVDAGLGELGRQGYLIADKLGARLRVFAVTTDMTLVPDKPVSMGAEEFCQKCVKCADSCPSQSIPTGEKTIHNGVEKWKLDEESCFDYWGKIGTDCCICMAVCPFSRPDTALHRIVRWMVARSPVAKNLFPILDNFIYGKTWKPRPVPSWLDYSK